MKINLRLAYERLADALRHHRLVESEALRLTLHQCLSTGALFPELLVREGMVSDWELSRLCCETFSLPFLPVDFYQPDKKLLEKLDVEFLRQYGIVPLDAFGDVMTVAMPGMVPTEVLTALSESSGKRLLPVVGTVQSNQQWLERNLPPPAALRELREAAEGGDWVGIFDAGDAAVRSGIGDEGGVLSLDELPAPLSAGSAKPDTDAAKPDTGDAKREAAAARGDADGAQTDEPPAATPRAPSAAPTPAAPSRPASGLRLKGDGDEGASAA